MNTAKAAYAVPPSPSLPREPPLRLATGHSQRTARARIVVMHVFLGSFMLVACARQAPDALIKQGHEALWLGRCDSAIDHFSRAAGSAHPGSREYIVARVGIVEAMAAGGDRRCDAEYMELMGRFSECVDDAQLERMVMRMLEAQALLTAYEAIEFAVRQRGPSPLLKELSRELEARPRGVPPGSAGLSKATECLDF